MTRKLWDWTDFSLVASFLGQMLTNVFFLGGKNIAALTLEQNGGKFIHTEVQQITLIYIWILFPVELWVEDIYSSVVSVSLTFLLLVDFSSN